MPPDRRTGRRSRRQRNSAKVPDGKHQSMSSDKDSMEIRSLQVEGRLKEQAISHDNSVADSSKFRLNWMYFLFLLVGILSDYNK